MKVIVFSKTQTNFYSLPCLSPIFFHLFLHFTLKILLFQILCFSLYGSYFPIPTCPIEVNIIYIRCQPNQDYFFRYFIFSWFHNIEKTAKTSPPSKRHNPWHKQITGASFIIPTGSDELYRV